MHIIVMTLQNLASNTIKLPDKQQSLLENIKCFINIHFYWTTKVR